MSALAATEYALDPLRDSRHRDAKSARELQDWLIWLEVSNKAPRTLDNYERICARLLRAFPDKTFGEFTDGDILQLLSTFPKKSRHIYRSALEGWFGWGYRTRRLKANPVDLIPSIRYRPVRHYDIFTPAETDALCGIPPPDGQLMTLLLWVGLRQGEARELTGKRVDLERRQVIVLEGVKGGRDRKVPMIGRVSSACADLLTLEGIGRDDYLWYDRPGGGRVRRAKPVVASAFARWWVKSIDVAGVRYRNPHTTRHTFATRMRQLGLPMEEVQQLLGHESIRTTSDTYVHTNIDAIGDRMREFVGDIS